MADRRGRNRSGGSGGVGGGRLKVEEKLPLLEKLYKVCLLP